MASGIDARTSAEESGAPGNGRAPEGQRSREERRSPDAPRSLEPGRADAAPSREPSEPPEPPTAEDLAWVSAIALVKSAIVALAIDAFVNSDSPRFRGKGMRIRAFGYTGALLIVPAIWRLRGRHARYPRELDLLVALPLLGDAAGNAVGIYQRAHVDDAIHFANGALLTAVVGALATPRARTSWEAAGFATAVGTAAAAVWEMLEWTGLKLGARGMDLSYDDTMEDLIETAAGALLGGVITLLRHPARLAHVPGRSSDPVLRFRPEAPSGAR